MDDLKPSFMIVAGPNGSGKTTLTRMVLQHDWAFGHHYINADDIAQQELGDWNSPEAVLKAAQIADRRREDYLANRQDFVSETVFSTSARVAFVERALAAGYFVRMYFVGTSDPAINVERIRKRVTEGGHDVPTDKIVARYHRSIANLQGVLPVVDRAYVFDNSIDRMPAVRWARTRNGIIARVADGEMPRWIEEALTSPAPKPAPGSER